MADAYKKLYQGQLAASVATIYTVPAATSAIIKHIAVVNRTGNAVTFQLWRDGTTDAFAFTAVMPLAPNGMADWDGTFAMNTGETLAGAASSAAGITVTIDGDEIT